MQEDANANCERCNGEGEEYHYFVNHKDKYVGTDWSYCLACFPGSSCNLHFDVVKNWERATLQEYDKYIKMGYGELDY